MISGSLLGKTVSYKGTYDKSLLFGVKRGEQRENIQIKDTPLPFQGFDLWSCYELSWLNIKGKPCIATLSLKIPCDSPFLIESKSLKLYLNSFNLTKIQDPAALQALLCQDLSHIAGAQIEVQLTLPQNFNTLAPQVLVGESLDEIDLEITSFTPQPEALATGERETCKTLTTHLFRSKCPVTAQPDWGSIQIAYQGKEIEKEGLLRYLLSFREHQEFHELCVERIFVDILKKCKPKELAVFGRFTRRGGLEINPFRKTLGFEESFLKLSRDFRQ
jgi:7-cyano-7-deazaguanine reductase